MKKYFNNAQEIAACATASKKSNKYSNNLLGKSKEEIKKAWDDVYAQIRKLDPVKNVDKLVVLNEQFDKCVEAFYAKDCGNYWCVTGAKTIGGIVKTYKVKKELVGSNLTHEQAK